jgi:hypothetical protein
VLSKGAVLALSKGALSKGAVLVHSKRAVLILSKRQKGLFWCFKGDVLILKTAPFYRCLL